MYSQKWRAAWREETELPQQDEGNSPHKCVHTSEMLCSTSSLLHLGDSTSFLDTCMERENSVKLWTPQTLYVVGSALKGRRKETRGTSAFPPYMPSLCTVTEVSFFFQMLSLLITEQALCPGEGIVACTTEYKIWRTKALSARPCLCSGESWKGRSQVPEQPQPQSGCLLNGN